MPTTNKLGWKDVIAATVVCTSSFAEAGPITITNVTDTSTVFLTRVTGSVGIFNIHNLVDIPNTPWVNTSRIIEFAGPFADNLNVSWTSQHITGPHANDLDPNGSAALSFSFSAAAPGAFAIPAAATRLLPHRLATGGFHLDDFVMALTGIVTTGFAGHLDITSYEITYLARHCLAPDPGCFTGPPPGPGPGPGGFAEIPEPATLLLLVLGFLGMSLSHGRRKIRKSALPFLPDRY